jgi:hypothetical protein
VRFEGRESTMVRFQRFEDKELAVARFESDI